MLISLDDLRICLDQEIQFSWPSNILKRFDVTCEVGKWESLNVLPSLSAAQ